MSDEHTIIEPSDDLAALREELEKCTREAQENLDGWKRAKADYVNYKNETEKRRDELAAMALMTSAGQFIPLLDNFKTAFRHLPDDLKSSEWVKGIEHIWSQMKEIMKGLGVEELSDVVVGSPFDPAKHYAVGEERVDTHDDNIVTQEVNPGYTFRGNLMVPAKVIVNRKPESASPDITTNND